MAIKHGSVVTYSEWLLPMMSHKPLYNSHVRSHDKFNKWYLHFYVIYGHYTWQGVDLEEVQNANS